MNKFEHLFGSYMALEVTKRSALSNSATCGHSTSSRKLNWMSTMRASFPMLLICRNTEQASSVSSTL